MSGHSKWHNIQAKKGKADAARGRIFTKLGREIAVAAKGNPNPDTNSKLADAIAKAKANNMPNDNIQRCIKRRPGNSAASITKHSFTRATARAARRSSSTRLPTIKTARRATCAAPFPSAAANSAVRVAFRICSAIKGSSSSNARSTWTKTR